MSFDLSCQRNTFEDFSLNWLIKNLNMFAINPMAANLTLLQAVKPIADLAQVAEIMIRTPRHEKVGHYFLDHCWNELDKGDLLVRLMGIADYTLILATIYPPFFRTQRRNSQLEHKIATIQAFNIINTFHQLPIAYVISEIGETPPWSLQLLLEQEWKKLTTFNHKLSLIDVYVLVHNVLYATGYGTRPEGLLNMQRQFIETRINSVFNQFLVKKNLDVIAELILMTRQHPNVSPPDSAWELLIASQHDNGMVPKLLDSNVQKDASNKFSYIFLRNYHTTLVSIASCLVENDT
jgi:hypothetical protein